MHTPLKPPFTYRCADTLTEKEREREREREREERGRLCLRETFCSTCWFDRTQSHMGLGLREPYHGQDNFDLSLSFNIHLACPFLSISTTFALIYISSRAYSYLHLIMCLFLFFLNLTSKYLPMYINIYHVYSFLSISSYVEKYLPCIFISFHIYLCREISTTYVHLFISMPMYRNI